MSGHVRGSFERGQINQLSIAGIQLCNNSFPGMVVFLFLIFLLLKEALQESWLQHRGAGSWVRVSVIRLITLAKACVHSF